MSNRTEESPSTEPVKLFTPEAVADILSVSISTVLRWLQAGDMPGVHIGKGNLWRVKEPDLIAWIENEPPVESIRRPVKTPPPERETPEYADKVDLLIIDMRKTQSSQAVADYLNQQGVAKPGNPRKPRWTANDVTARPQRYTKRHQTST